MTRLLLSRKAGSDKIDKTGSPRVQLLDTTYNLQQRKNTLKNLSNHFSLWFLFNQYHVSLCQFCSVNLSVNRSRSWIYCHIRSCCTIEKGGMIILEQGRWRHNNVWLHVGKEMPSKLFSSPIPSGTGAESDAAENLGEINARNVVLIQTQSWYIGEKFHKG